MSSAPPPVANSGEDAITRSLDAAPEAFAAPEVPLAEAYEVEPTLDEITRGGYSRVALQFPDELLHDAVPVYRALRDRLPAETELYVLADTTYGRLVAETGGGGAGRPSQARQAGG